MASRGNQQKRIYALYRGDQYVCDGTADELSQETGLRVVTIHYYATAKYHRWLETHGTANSVSVDPVKWTRKKRRKN